jgi:L-rhamnose mutarotase
MGSSFGEKSMIRKAFVMRINVDAEEEYARRHQPIWPAMQEVLKNHGVHNYSIFLHKETRQLFAYAEIESEEQWSAISATPACRQWWHHMADLMPHNPDGSPITTTVTEVFHLD